MYKSNNSVISKRYSAQQHSYKAASSSTSPTYNRQNYRAHQTRKIIRQPQQQKQQQLQTCTTTKANMYSNKMATTVGTSSATIATNIDDDDDDDEMDTTDWYCTSPVPPPFRSYYQATPRSRALKCSDKTIHPTRIHHHHPYQQPHVRRTLDRISGQSSSLYSSTTVVYDSHDDDHDDGDISNSSNFSSSTDNDDSSTSHMLDYRYHSRSSMSNSDDTVSSTTTDTQFSQMDISAISKDTSTTVDSIDVYMWECELFANNEKDKSNISTNSMDTSIHSDSSLDIFIDIDTEIMQIYHFKSRLSSNVQLLPFCALYLNKMLSSHSSLTSTCDDSKWNNNNNTVLSTHSLRRKRKSREPNLDVQQLSSRRPSSECLPSLLFLNNLMGFLSHHTNVDDRCFLVACMYISEAIKHPQFEFSSENLVSIVCTCLMLSAKFNEDEYLHNIDWCKMMPVSELRQCQKDTDATLTAATYAIKSYSRCGDLDDMFDCDNSSRYALIQEQMFSNSLRTLNTHEVWILQVLDYQLYRDSSRVKDFVTANYSLLMESGTISPPVY